MLASGSLGVLCYTYAGLLTLTIQADPNTVTDPNMMCTIFETECNRMIAQYDESKKGLSKAEKKV